MSHKQPAYVIFDSDEDGWAYRFMRGWKSNERIDFDFFDAHDLTSMTSQATSEDYVKRQLRERMGKAKCVILLLGDRTKFQYRYIRWEIDLAIELNIPIVVANLNERTSYDSDLCPPILREHCAVHIPFKMKAIKYALDNWPSEYRGFDLEMKSSGRRHYGPDVYRTLGI